MTLDVIITTTSPSSLHTYNYINIITYTVWTESSSGGETYIVVETQATIRMPFRHTQLLTNKLSLQKKYHRSGHMYILCSLFVLSLIQPVTIVISELIMLSSLSCKLVLGWSITRLPTHHSLPQRHGSENKTEQTGHVSKRESTKKRIKQQNASKTWTQEEEAPSVPVKKWETQLFPETWLTQNASQTRDHPKLSAG